MQSFQAHKVRNRDYLISPKQLQGKHLKTQHDIVSGKTQSC